MAEQLTAVGIGEFGWFDLSTSDPEAGRNFYSKLLGWAAEVVPDPQAGGYGFFRRDGKEVAGVGPLMGGPQQPTAWTAYVLVENADDVAKRAKENGGTVLNEPFDVMGQGIMAIIADPAGAVFGIWQPGQHRGVELRDAPFSVCWVDSMSRDIEKSKAFYPAVLGWEVKDSQMEGGEYWLLENGGKQVGGLFPPMPGMPAEVPSFWQVHFAVDDADAICARATELGGSVTSGPMDIPTVGRAAGLRDPQGATFGILQPAPRG